MLRPRAGIGMKGIHSDLVVDRRDGAPWRVTFRRTDDGIGIYNPTRRKYALVAFLLVWLAGWGAGEYFALSQIITSGNPLAVDLFLLVWVTGWTLGGLVVLSVVAWHLVGVEKLFLIEGGGIVTERGFGPFTRRRIHPVDRISEVGYTHPMASEATGGMFSKGAVTFYVDGEPRTFGIELDGEETARVVDLITAFLDRHRPAEAAAAPPGEDGETPEAARG